jgi:hypothetical protein
MSKRSRVTVDGNPLAATKREPAFWGKAIEVSWETNKHWAKPIVLNVDPIDDVILAGGRKTNMRIINGVYTMGRKVWILNGGNTWDAGAWNTVVFLLTTSQFDMTVANHSPVGVELGNISPVQLEPDPDCIFRGSSTWNGGEKATAGNGGGVFAKDMEIIPAGSHIDLVTPTLYLYAWRGPIDLTSTSATLDAGAQSSTMLLSFKLSYYMVNLSAEQKLDEYIAATNNASFLGITRAV